MWLDHRRGDVAGGDPRRADRRPRSAGIHVLRPARARRRPPGPADVDPGRVPGRCRHRLLPVDPAAAEHGGRLADLGAGAASATRCRSCSWWSRWSSSAGSIPARGSLGTVRMPAVELPRRPWPAAVGLAVAPSAAVAADVGQLAVRRRHLDHHGADRALAGPAHRLPRADLAGVDGVRRHRRVRAVARHDVAGAFPSRCRSWSRPPSPRCSAWPSACRRCGSGARSWRW